MIVVPKPPPDWRQKDHYRKILTAHQLSYSAGFVDGEGCISIQKTKGSVPYYSPHVDVVNTYKEVLETLREWTSFGKISPHKKHSKWKQGWVWKLHTDEIGPFLTAILPGLIVKEWQARIMLEFLAYPSRNKYRETDWKIIQGCEFCFQEITKLNKKGS